MTKSPPSTADLFDRRWKVRTLSDASELGIESVVLAVSSDGVNPDRYVAEFDERHLAELVVAQHNAAIDNPPPRGFQDDLARVINRWSMETGSNTPDHLLAAYLRRCVEAADILIGRRDSWYGVALRPGHDYEPVADQAEAP